MEEKEEKELDAPGQYYRPSRPVLPPTQGRYHRSMEEKEKKELCTPGQYFRPSWLELPSAKAGTTALTDRYYRVARTSTPKDRNFRPYEAHMQISAFGL
jgi:hypothetical protein